MALPTKEKTWQYNINQLSSGAAYDVVCKDLMFKIKQSLVGFGTLPWTVWGSCNGAGGAGSFGNNDGVDRWLSTANLNWASSGNHSWIVLRQSGLGASAALCIDLLGSNACSIGLVLFPTGVGTVGTATARPSALDEIVLLSSAGWGGPNTATNTRLHVTQSTDGQCTRAVICRANLIVALWLFDVAKNPSPSWASPTVFGVACGTWLNSEQVNYANYNDSSAYCWGRINATTCNFYMTSEGWGGSTLGEQITFPDDDTGEYPMSNIHLSCSTTGARGAKKGSLYDLWWASTAPANGDCYPSDTSKQFVTFGDLIFPWNGSTPLIT